MAAGRPVIATRAGGPLDSVLEGETGLLVTPSDPADLAAAVKRLLADPEAALAMGRNGRQRAIECFSIEHITESISEILRRATGRVSG